MTRVEFDVDPRPEADYIVAVLHNLGVVDFTGIRCFTADGQERGYAYHQVISPGEIEMVVSPDVTRVVLEYEPDA